MLDAQTYLGPLLRDLEMVEARLRATDLNSAIVSYHLVLLEEIHIDFLSAIRCMADRGMPPSEEEKFAILERIQGVRDCALTQRQSLVFSDLPSNDYPLVNISPVQVSPPQLSALGMKWSTMAISVSTQGRASEMVAMRQMPDVVSLADTLIVADASPAVNQPQNSFPLHK